MLSKWQNNTSCVYANKALLAQLVVGVSILYLCISARNCIFNVCVYRWKENTWKWIYSNIHAHIKQKINVKIKIEKKKKREKRESVFEWHREKQFSVYTNVQYFRFTWLEHRRELRKQKQNKKLKPKRNFVLNHST